MFQKRLLSLKHNFYSLGLNVLSRFNDPLMKLRPFKEASTVSKSKATNLVGMAYSYFNYIISDEISDMLNYM